MATEIKNRVSFVRHTMSNIINLFKNIDLDDMSAYMDKNQALTFDQAFLESDKYPAKTHMFNINYMNIMCTVLIILNDYRHKLDKEEFVIEVSQTTQQKRYEQPSFLKIKIDVKDTFSACIIGLNDEDDIGVVPYMSYQTDNDIFKPGTNTCVEFIIMNNIKYRFYFNLSANMYDYYCNKNNIHTQKIQSNIIYDIVYSFYTVLYASIHMDTHPIKNIHELFKNRSFIQRLMNSISSHEDLAIPTDDIIMKLDDEAEEIIDKEVTRVGALLSNATIHNINENGSNVLEEIVNTIFSLIGEDEDANDEDEITADRQGNIKTAREEKKEEAKSTIIDYDLTKQDRFDSSKDNEFLVEIDTKPTTSQNIDDDHKTLVMQNHNIIDDMDNVIFESSKGFERIFKDPNQYMEIAKAIKIFIDQYDNLYSNEKPVEFPIDVNNGAVFVISLNEEEVSAFALLNDNNKYELINVTSQARVIRESFINKQTFNFLPSNGIKPVNKYPNILIVHNMEIVSSIPTNELKKCMNINESTKPFMFYKDYLTLFYYCLVNLHVVATNAYKKDKNSVIIKGASFSNILNTLESKSIFKPNEAEIIIDLLENYRMEEKTDHSSINGDVGIVYPDGHKSFWVNGEILTVEESANQSLFMNDAEFKIITNAEEVIIPKCDYIFRPDFRNDMIKIMKYIKMQS